MFPLFKFRVEGSSMSPAFKAGDIILVNRLSYLLSKPKVGEVVVLRKRKFIIKRIVKVKNDKFFVLGDNKQESADSRNFGWISKKEIVGKVIFKI